MNTIRPNFSTNHFRTCSRQRLVWRLVLAFSLTASLVPICRTFVFAEQPGNSKTDSAIARNDVAPTPTRRRPRVNDVKKLAQQRSAVDLLLTIANWQPTASELPSAMFHRLAQQSGLDIGKDWFRNSYESVDSNGALALIARLYEEIEEASAAEKPAAAFATGIREDAANANFHRLAYLAFVLNRPQSGLDVSLVEPLLEDPKAGLRTKIGRFIDLLKVTNAVGLNFDDPFMVRIRGRLLAHIESADALLLEEQSPQGELLQRIERSCPDANSAALDSLREAIFRRLGAGGFHRMAANAGAIESRVQDWHRRRRIEAKFSGQPLGKTIADLANRSPMPIWVASRVLADVTLIDCNMNETLPAILTSMLKPSGFVIEPATPSLLWIGPPSDRAGRDALLAQGQRQTIGTEARRTLLSRPVNVNFQDTPIAEVLNRLREVLNTANLVMMPSQVRPETPFTLKCVGTPACVALTNVCREFGLDWIATDEAILLTEPRKLPALRTRVLAIERETTRARTEAKVQSMEYKLAQLTSVDFVQVSLEEAVRHIRDEARITAVVYLPDERARPAESQFTLKLDDVSIHLALLLAAESTGLDMLVSSFIVVIAEEQVVADIRETIVRDRALFDRVSKSGNASEVEKALLRPISFDFTETRMCDVLEFIKDYARINVVSVSTPDDEDWREAPVTLQMEQAPLLTALRAILWPHGLSVAWEEYLLIVGPRKTVAAYHNELASDSALLDRLRSSKVLGQVEQAMLRPISFDFTETPIWEALDFVNDFTQLNVFQVPADENWSELESTLQLEQVPLLTALRCLLLPHNLSMEWEDTILVIGPANAVGAYGKGLAADRQLLERWNGENPPNLPARVLSKKISLDFGDRTLADAIEFIAGATKSQFYVSPRVVPKMDIGKKAVTVHVDQVPLVCGLRLVLQPLELEWKTDGYFFYIGDKQRVEEFREQARRRSDERSRYAPSAKPKLSALAAWNSAAPSLDRVFSEVCAKAGVEFDGMNVKDLSKRPNAITKSLVGVPVDSLLDLLCLEHDLNWRLEGEGERCKVVVFPR